MRKKKMQKKMEQIMKFGEKYMSQELAILDKLRECDLSVYRQVKYIKDWSGYPVYENTQTDYYKCGEEMFEDMVAALEHAKQSIFMEYFIVGDGYLFHKILNILERKAKKGVDVRLIYDDIGSLNTIPNKFLKMMEEKGIKCCAFNPVNHWFHGILNYRDHRKIMVIDGMIAFTGGMNLADEYINQKKKYGYWKDTGIRLVGEGAWSFTVMFLIMWDFIHQTMEDYEQFKPNRKEVQKIAADGYVLPYCDDPFRREHVCETVYLNMINQAVHSVFIFTPYLILDKDFMLSLIHAAKRGVDVRIVTPGIPDKRFIFFLTQSYYPPLLEGGVKIYQYRPGFLHAKSILCDDKIAMVGSVNLDYRSLYLQFECGVYLYQAKAIEDLKKDYLDLFAHSDEMKIAYCKQQKMIVKFIQMGMRLIAPIC